MGFASQIKEQMINTPPEPGRAGRGAPTAANVRGQTSVVPGSSWVGRARRENLRYSSAAAG